MVLRFLYQVDALLRIRTASNDREDPTPAALPADHSTVSHAMVVQPVSHTADTAAIDLRSTPVDLRNPPGLTTCVLMICLFGMIYGAVLGSYGVLFGGELFCDRALQIVYAAIKVPMLLAVTFLLCLPLFFVGNGLLGLRQDFMPSIRALIATQAGLSVILASLAPFTAFWYISYGEYNAALLFNAVMFAVASFGGQALLRRLYAPLIQRDPRHRIMLWIWLLLFAFVGIQMGWVLRPFVGSLGSEVAFFREDPFSNAYVIIIQITRGAFGL